MKKLISITIIIALLAAGIVCADQGFVNFGSLEKVRSGTRGIGLAKNVSGPATIKADSACTLFRNLTTMARVNAGTGYPLSANVDYTYTFKPNTHLSFTCATSATAKYVYIVR